jgi:orotate phosphoribosyltransferase
LNFVRPKADCFRAHKSMRVPRVHLNPMPVDLQSLLDSSGAIRKGHFILTSGRHSDVYFEKFRVLERPDVLSALCASLIEQLGSAEFDAVAGPTTGGIIIAFEVARQLGLAAIYVETEEGQKALRRGRVLDPGTRVLVVDDVLTTGKSLIETRWAIEAAEGNVTAYAVLIDRSGNDLQLDLPLYAAHKVEAQSFAADEIPGWLAAIPAEKPGTRKG